jgi:hypothetical protein
MPYIDPEPKWAHDTWKRTPDDWQGAQREVRAHLIATARRRSVTTYLEIHGSISSTEIPSTGNAFQNAIGVLLGQVNLIESRRFSKRMMLSAVAVNKDLHPGAGVQRVLEKMEWEGDWPTWLATVWRTYAKLK